MKDYYYILGLSDQASKDAIREAYKKLSKKFHPDLNDDDKFFEDRFKEIQEAYEVLSDDAKRRNYDLRRKPIDPATTAKKSPVSDNTTGFNSKEKQPKQGQRTSLRKPLVAIAGIVVFTGLLFLIFKISGGNPVVDKSLSTAKHTDICNCKISITPNNFGVKIGSYRDIILDANFDNDSLIGNVDSIVVQESKKNRRSDENAEETSNVYTDFYSHNKITGTTDKGISSRWQRSEKSKRNVFFYNNNNIVKQVKKSADYDSVTLSYEYLNCRNGLSKIDVYNKAGENVGECRIWYNDTAPVVNISIDEKGSSGSVNDRVNIANYRIEFDGNCEIQKIKEVCFYDGYRSAKTEAKETIYNERGLIIEEKHLSIHSGSEKLPVFYDGDDDKNISSIEHYDYQYDKTGNWIVKTIDKDRFIKRTIYYHNPH